jgi:agmatine/peptidylarginine deiminase
MTTVALAGSSVEVDGEGFLLHAEQCGVDPKGAATGG